MWIIQISAVYECHFRSHKVEENQQTSRNHTLEKAQKCVLREIALRISSARQDVLFESDISTFVSKTRKKRSRLHSSAASEGGNCHLKRFLNERFIICQEDAATITQTILISLTWCSIFKKWKINWGRPRRRNFFLRLEQNLLFQLLFVVVATLSEASSREIWFICVASGEHATMIPAPDASIFYKFAPQTIWKMETMFYGWGPARVCASCCDLSRASELSILAALSPCKTNAKW